LISSTRFAVKSRNKEGLAMKILVTEATGKVGGAVVEELLKRDASVCALVRKEPQDGKVLL
jgi:nucleoside-diphosphate-sugar epimerase